MPRVEIQFDGRNRGALTATKQVAERLEQLKITAAETAKQNVIASRNEREGLEALRAEYRRLATSSELSGKEQAAASRLAARAQIELSHSHGGSARAAKTAEKELSGLTRGATAATGVFGHLGRAVAFAGGTFLGAYGVVAVMHAGLTEAASLERQMTRTTDVFGRSGQATLRWSKDSATAMGLARADALDAANSIGTLLKNVGLAPARARPMSQSLVQLASDMAAFKGVKPEQALQALEAALQGRTRSLKVFGVVIDQAALKEEAYRTGIAKAAVSTNQIHDAEVKLQLAQYHLNEEIAKHGPKSAEAAKATLELQKAQTGLAKAQAGTTGQLTAGQKALAAYSLIMRQTGDQQGAFAKHSGNLAQQEQILHAQIKDLEGELGTALIPTLEKFLPLITGWIDRNEKNGKLQRDINKTVHAAGTVLDTFVGIVHGAKTALDALGKVVGGDKTALELLAAFLISAKLLGGFSGLVAAMGEGGGAAGIAKLLRTRLLALRALGTIGVTIVVAFEVAKGAQALSRWLGKQGWAQALGIGDTPLPAGVTFNDVASAMSAYKAGKTLTAKQRQTLAAMGVNVGAGAPGELGDLLSGGSVGSAGPARAIGATGPVTAGISTLEHYLAPLGGHVNDDYATSGHATHSYHYKGEAADLAPNPAVWSALYARRGLFAELFGPTNMPGGGGLFHYGVQFYDAALQKEHQNHIHVAFTGSMAAIDKAFGGTSKPPKVPAASTPTPTPTPTGDTSTSTGGFVEKPKPPKASDVAKLPANVRLQLARAGATTGLQDDITANEAAIKILTARLNKATSSGVKAELQAAIDRYLAAIKAARKKLREQAAAEASRELVLRGITGGLKAAQPILQQAFSEGLLPAAEEQKIKTQEASLRALIRRAARDGVITPAELKAIQRSWSTLKTEIGDANKAVADEAARKAEQAWSGVVTKIERAIAEAWQITQRDFDRQTSAGVQAIQDSAAADLEAMSRAFQAQMTLFNRETEAGLKRIQDDASARIAQLQRDFQAQLTAFDKATEAGLAQFQVAQTPEEAQLAAFEAQRQADQLAQTQAQEQSALAAAIASGDPAQIQQAQDAINQTLLDIQQAALQAAADQSRVAADKLAQQQQDAYQAQRDLLKQSLTDQEQAREDAIQATADAQTQAYQDSRDALAQSLQDEETDREKARQAQADAQTQAYQDERDAQWQHLSDMHDDEVTKLEDDLATWQLWLANKQKSYADFYAWLQANPDANALAGIPLTDYTGGDTSTTAFDPTVVGAIGQAGGRTAGFASGGWSTKPPSPTIDPRDTIPAWLQPGEYVMSPDEVAQGFPDWNPPGLARARARANAHGQAGLTVALFQIDGREIARAIAVPMTEEQARQISYVTPRG